MRALLRSLRALMPTLNLRPWVLPLLISLGLLGALTDGLSTSLIIPLVQNSSGTTSQTGVLRYLWALFDRLPPEQRFTWTGLSILACVILKNGIGYGNSLYSQRVNNRITHRLRCAIVQQLLKVSQSYLDKQDPGKPLNTLLSETWQVSAAFSLMAGEIVNISMILIFSTLLLLISWKLTLVAIGSLWFILKLIQQLTVHAKQLGSEANTANRILTERALQIYNALRLIRAFGREDYEQQRFDVDSHRVTTTFYAMDRACALVGPTSEILTFLLLLGILALPPHTSGAISASLTFLLVLYRLHPRIKQLSADWASLQGFSTAIQEVSSLISEAGKPYLQHGDTYLGALQDGITFEDLSLCYEAGNKPALNGINLFIRRGTTIALVGPSGAGKSSLISLICRFYDPTAGRVLVDDVPLSDLDLNWWRNQIALVSQDVHLFNASVRENILYGKLDATEDELLEATRKAHALEIINDLPDGFETPLGDRGLRLSGGQRQRIALARAFIRDPQILILDEATNSLDLISEQLVQDALEEFAIDRTVIIIAHRLNTIENADHIVVLDSGRVVEAGTLSELLERSGLFSELYKLQFKQRITVNQPELAAPMVN